MKFNKKYDIVGLGACGIDLRARVPKLPTLNNKVTATHMEVSEGGVTSNNLAQVAKIGLKAAWVGAFGNDDWAKYLKDKFRKINIQSFPINVSTSPTQQFWITTNPEGEWIMVGIPGATRKITASDVKNKFSKIIALGKHFHTEVAVIPLAVALAGAEIAKENSAKVLIDIDDDPWYLIEEEEIGTKKEFTTLLKIADIVKFSKTAAVGLTKEKSFSKRLLANILKMGPEIVVVTLAEKGCFIGTKKKIIHVPGYSVETVDTVGAGDAFMGRLSYGLLKNWELEKVGKFANACGAFKCTKFGTRSSGNLKEITHFIKSYA